MGKQYYVYIMANKNNTVLYTEMSDNLVKRVWQHKQSLRPNGLKNKVSDSFTAKYNANKLVYYEIADRPMTVIDREKAIKNLVRRKKDKLITDFNPTWRDLYKDILD